MPALALLGRISLRFMVVSFDVYAVYALDYEKQIEELRKIAQALMRRKQQKEDQPALSSLSHREEMP